MVSMEGLAVTPLKHSRKAHDSAHLVMNRSTLVHECLEDLWEALLQDTHRTAKMVPVEILAVWSTQGSLSQAMFIKGRVGIPKDRTCSNKHEAIKDSLALLRTTSELGLNDVSSASDGSCGWREPAGTESRVNSTQENFHHVTITLPSTIA